MFGDSTSTFLSLVLFLLVYLQLNHDLGLTLLFFQSLLIIIVIIAVVVGVVVITVLCYDCLYY